jgi:hypothetical protein
LLIYYSLKNGRAIDYLRAKAVLLLGLYPDNSKNALIQGFYYPS